MTSNYYNGPKLKFHEIMDLYKKKNKITQKDGYIYIYLPEHPNAQKGGYIRFHRLVLEEHLGRYLKRGERTHHINWGFGNALEVDADHAPVNTKSSLESECETHGKSCKPIKVVVELRRAK